MSDPKVVIFDIDDVLMPWAEVVHHACIEAGLTPKGSRWSSWSMWEDYKCTREQWLEVVNTLVIPNGVYHGKPYPGVLEAIDDLWQTGAEIHLVTARGFFDHADQIRTWTEDWIAENLIPGRLQFAQDKGRVAMEIGATHAIDDNLKNVTEMADAGADAYLMTQPHNELSYFNPNRRVANVPQFVDRILNG